MGRVIAFINFKGGVGKTSNAVNLGAVLAHDHGKKVLIVDLDAQCNASYWLLRSGARRELEDNPQYTTWQIFRDHIQGTQIFDFEEAVVKAVPRSGQGNPHIAKLDLLAAHVDLLEVEDQLGHRHNKPYFTFLEKTLKPYVKEYDYVFLDCPPNIYNVSKNALFFADDYVIPYVPDYLSLSGFRVFARVVKQFQEQASGFKPKLHKPRITGVVVNRFKTVGNVFQTAINELALTLGDLRAEKLVHEKARVFKPWIRDCVRLAECSSEHLPVIIHNPNALSSQDYQDLAADFLLQINALES